MTTRTVFPNKKALLEAVVAPGMRVLDVGFKGQGIQQNNNRWPHALIRARTDYAYGIDLTIDRTQFPDSERYKEASAEAFTFPGTKFDIIFAGDLIEHLCNPGKFLDACAQHMGEESTLVITTPNCFNLFNISEKFSKDEPTINADHTVYFNHRTLRTLLAKCGFHLESIQYIYSLEYDHPESWKKKVLNSINYMVGLVTPKFNETLVVTARIRTAVGEDI